MNITLKKLTENELELIMNWRMREDITKYLFTNPQLTLEGQKKWFEKIKNSNSEIRWVIYVDNVPVGLVYIIDIDHTNKKCELGWFIGDKKVRSLELATTIQRNMYDYVFDVLKFNRIYGFIIDENTRVLSLDTYCGFEYEGLLKQHICKEGIFHDVYAIGLTKDMWQEKKINYDYEKIEIQ